ncbi:MAG: hypothetical protein R3247_03615 [Rhodothermales bacterium]|nr:hypothetical protein [Rhodothermales bacterium]
MPLLLRTVAGVVVLAAVHLFGERLRVLHGMPRSRWLSAAGGVSAAYVFVHLLPELAHAQATIEEATEGAIAFLDHHIYLVALAGLVTFYGLEHLAKTRSTGGAPEAGENDAVFWIHIGSFALYNALVGYLLLHLDEGGGPAVALFTVAMALHFVVNDVALASHHQAAYRRKGRWVLAAAVLVGWLIGVVAEVPEPAVVVLVAFLAGGIILNVLKEELPEERESRFWAFLAGAAAYAALLLVL